MLVLSGIILIIIGIAIAAKCAPFTGYDFKACACSWMLLIGFLLILASTFFYILGIEV